MKIGFIGLGGMGRAIAGNLLRAGHEVRVWNRSPGPAEELAKDGAQVATSPSDCAAGAEILFSILSEDRSVRAVILDGGALDALPKGAIHANLATVSVEFAREMTAAHAAAGAGYAAIPVLGRPDMAQAARLNIIAAGAPEVLERLAPVLDVIGLKTWVVGSEPAQANAVKLSANFMIAAAIGAMGEGAALAEAHGVAVPDFLDLVTSTLFACRVYEGYGGLIARDTYEPAGFKLSLGAKDVRLALAASDQARVPMPIASVLRDGYVEALAKGYDDQDWAALARIARARAARPEG